MVSIKNLPTLNELLVLLAVFFFLKSLRIRAIINHTGKYC